MIRLGVIGLGLRVGHFIRETMNSVDPDFRVVGVVDPGEAKSREKMRDCDQDAVFYNSIDEMVRLSKPDALLVNVGRGTMIVTKDLEAVLAEGHLSGAILDVVDPEPLPEDSPLWDCDRVLLTPHVSGIGFDHEPATEEAIWEICEENLRRYCQGLPLRNRVDIQAGY